MRRCRVSSSFRVNVLPQFGLSQTNGLSPLPIKSRIRSGADKKKRERERERE